MCFTFETEILVPVTVFGRPLLYAGNRLLLLEARTFQELALQEAWLLSCKVWDEILLVKPAEHVRDSAAIAGDRIQSITADDAHACCINMLPLRSEC